MSSRGKHGFFSLGMLFLLIGLVWMQAIYQRCEVIYPTSLRLAAKEERGAAGKSVAAGEQGVQKALSQKSATEKKQVQIVRSPYAKDYHFILFWLLTIWEAVSALLYVMSGLMLLRKFSFAPGLGVVAVSADLGFKLSAITYMQFCAIPLAAATGNPNLMTAYFQATKNGWAWFSGFMSGLSLYDPHTRVDIIVAGCFIVFSFRVLLKNRIQKD